MPACRFLELASLLFQTCEAEGTEYTRVPGVHTAEEAVHELVWVSVSGRDFTRPLGATATSMNNFDMSSSSRVTFLFIADVFVCGVNLRSLHGTGCMREIILCGKWMFPAFWRKFLFEFTLSFFGSIVGDTLLVT